VTLREKIRFGELKAKTNPRKVLCGKVAALILLADLSAKK